MIAPSRFQPYDYFFGRGIFVNSGLDPKTYGEKINRKSHGKSGTKPKKKGSRKRK